MKPAIEKEKEKKTSSKKLEKNKQPFSQDKMSGEEESCEKRAIFPFVSIGKGWPLKGQSVKRTPYEEKKINMGKITGFSSICFVETWDYLLKEVITLIFGFSVSET